MNGSDKEWRVVCHGYYHDVYVVDVLTLEVRAYYSDELCVKFIKGSDIHVPLVRVQNLSQLVCCSMSSMYSGCTFLYCRIIMVYTRKMTTDHF